MTERDVCVQDLFVLDVCVQDVSVHGILLQRWMSVCGMSYGTSYGISVCRMSEG